MDDENNPELDMLKWYVYPNGTAGYHIVMHRLYNESWEQFMNKLNDKIKKLDKMRESYKKIQTPRQFTKIDKRIQNEINEAFSE